MAAKLTATLSSYPVRTPSSTKHRAGTLQIDSRLKPALISVLLSVVLLIPCFWHPRIEAGDLASHVYNAWLSSLVQQGRAPGLWIAPQNNNVLFDMLLLRLGALFGFGTAETIAVSIAVLGFFWSAFVLAFCVNRRACWFVVPLLAILSYGWTMEMGFFNFYLSLAVSFLALAIIWRAEGIRTLYALLLFPVVWLAHPLGLAWLCAAGAYVAIARRMAHMRWALAAASLMLVLTLRFFLASHFPVLWPTQVVWPGMHLYEFTGSAQLRLGSRYWFLPWALLLVAIICIVLSNVEHGRGGDTENGSRSQWLAPQLFVVSMIALMLLPDGIRLPQYPDAVLFICLRFTLAVGVLGCCALGALKGKSRRIFGASTTAIALAFFSLLYEDTGKTFAMERQAQTLINHVPQGARIISTLAPLSGSGVFSLHVVARACIQRCFVIDNYEAGSGQFRLRATAGNRILAADTRSTNEMMMGSYDVKPEDLPLWQIFQCGPSDIDLCLRPLRAGPMSLPQSVRVR